MRDKGISEGNQMVSERSDGDRKVDDKKTLDNIKTKSPLPHLNSKSISVNGTDKDADKNIILSTGKATSPVLVIEEESMSSSQSIEVDGRVANGQDSPVHDLEVESDDIGDADYENRKKQSSHQQQPKKVIHREKRSDDRRQTRSTSPKNPYGRTMRTSLIQTPIVWPPSNVPQSWAQFGGYHYPTQGRMPAPLALISPYTPTSNFHRLQTYVPMGNSSRGADSQMVSPPSHSSSSYSSMQSPQPGEKLSKTNLYIRGLPSSTTDDDLVNMCRIYGAIISTKAILDKDTNKCKGYGFVDFDSPISAQRAVAALQSKGIQAQMARQQEQDPTNLYLSNLPKNIDESQLQQMLSMYGRVISTRILKDGNGYSKGVGFARMESQEICENIIAKLCGQSLQGSTEPLLVKFADGGPKKRPQHQEKVWRDNEAGGYLTTYDVTHSTSPISTPGNTRVTAVMPGQGMISYTQGSSGSHYQQPVTGGVGWVQSQPYAVAVPMSPTSVDPPAITHFQQNVMPHLTSQMAQMQLPSGGYLTAVPTVAGYAPQSSWHVSQPQAPSHHGQVEESHFIVGSPESHDASVSRMHAGSSQQLQHPGEAIVDDQHRVVYAAYARK
ncbi:RNA-binding motif, single-stranded-interacting protein 2-like isoform X1 [Rhopilema esculentum]|uniref:RNA-binding motif, single-stranded-interacting protein 2-like isoform X1 n=2 Tax=Rhopilema esculentum TaxID=499914 RepID=UPI0031CEB318